MTNIAIAFGPSVVVGVFVIAIFFRRIRARRQGSRLEQRRVELLLDVFRRSQSSEPSES